MARSILCHPIVVCRQDTCFCRRYWPFDYGVLWESEMCANFIRLAVLIVAACGAAAMGIYLAVQ
ncbi:hypothetical protein [Bartonella sp. DGB2]|uniref:hypothetical protein n=1 Tax=Bartonella sp. DGB2 TaxID=3388426 RepID=UPI0039900B99